MVADRHPSENLGSRSDVDVSPQLGTTGDASACPQRDLLKDQAVGPDDGFRMDHDSIGVRKEQTSTDPRIQIDLRPRHDAPDAIPQDVPISPD